MRHSLVMKNDVLTEGLSVKLSKAQYVELRKAACKGKVSMSEYVRLAVALALKTADVEAIPQSARASITFGQLAVETQAV